jgi:cysteate synthase
LTIPEDNIDALWFDAPLNDCVKLVVSERGSDYFDAINLGNIAVKSPKFYAEGGAKNIARRDGMATTVLSAAEVIGRIPDYYFQAVGSGTGAIAAWEANMRLIEDGRFGNNKMKLIVSQNIPFTPMYDAWKEDSRALLPFSDESARIAASIIDAKVLSNRRPPYSINGGLYDALRDSGGTILCADNMSSEQAAKLFEETEGVDIHPAAGVALATLIQCIENRVIDPEAVIMLNVTGGGEKLYKNGKTLHYLKPSLVFPIDPDPKECLEKIEALFE